MYSRQPTPQREREIPFGLVLITIGTIMLLTVAGIVALSPVPLPLRDQIRLAVVAVAPGTAGYFQRPAPPQPARAVAGSVATPPPPALLPETPLGAGLPSEATVEEAATSLGETVPGQPVRLVIPRINLDAPVGPIELEAITAGGSNYYQWAVPNRFEAGWHNTSALLGQPGNTVLNGHHNVYGEVFRDLYQLAEGDQIILYDADQQPHVYRVAHQELMLEQNQPLSVRVTNARWIEPTQDERLTLVTCWPYTDNSHRLVVIARPAEDVQATSP